MSKDPEKHVKDICDDAPEMRRGRPRGRGSPPGNLITPPHCNAELEPDDTVRKQLYAIGEWTGLVQSRTNAARQAVELSRSGTPFSARDLQRAEVRIHLCQEAVDLVADVDCHSVPLTLVPAPLFSKIRHLRKLSEIEFFATFGLKNDLNI